MSTVVGRRAGDKRGFAPGANVVYDDRLVGEDIFVFGGHSARAARIDLWGRVW